jgi:CHAD domain-containing protein
MRMELRIHPDDAPRLPRLPSLTRQPGTRSRSRACKVVWHDGPNRPLASDHLALSEQRGVWRLEPLRPAGTPWPPATPAPVLEEASAPDALRTVLPDPLSPIAACEGRETTYPLLADGEPVLMTVLRGTVRGIADTYDIGRLSLDGPEGAILSLAEQLAAALRIEPPTGSLAAEAIALTIGIPPAPRHEGAPAVPAAIIAAQAVGGAFRHVLGHLVDVLLYQAPRAANPEQETEPVHQMRVAVRRARSAITVFGLALDCPRLRDAAEGLKEFGVRLGPVRDWDVFVTETLPRVIALRPDDPHLRRLQDAAERRRRAEQAALRAYLSSDAFRVRSVGLAWLAAAEDWLPPPPHPEMVDLAGFAAGVLRRRWRKLQADGKSIADHDVPALHRLRLRAKRMRYAAEVFAPVFPTKQAGRFIRRLSALQQQLGVLNDSAVAEQMLAALGGPTGRNAFASGIVLGYTAARATDIRPAIADAWKKLRGTDPFWT